MELKEQASYFAKSVAKDFNYASGVAGVVGGVVASFLGGWDVLIGVLTFFVVVDYVTGLLKAWHTNSLDSKIGFVGLIKKLYIFIAVAVAVQLQLIIGDNIPLREVVIFFYIANEGISFLENSSMFVEWPDAINQSFQQIRDKSNINKEDETDK